MGTAAYSVANSTAAEADVIDKLSERTAINREELQRWMHACDQSGVSSDVLESAVKKLSTALDDAEQGATAAREAASAFGLSLGEVERMGEENTWQYVYEDLRRIGMSEDEAARNADEFTDAMFSASSTSKEALDRLGISLDQLTGLTTEEKFALITDALADMEDGTDRNALGADLLGKAYTEMLPLLNAGSDGISALKQEADDLGIVMTESAVKSGVVLGDTIANIQAGLNGLKNKLGNTLMPIIQKGADLVLGALPKIEKMVDELMPTIESSFDLLLPPLMSLVETVFPLLMNTGQALLPTLIQLVSTILPLIVNLLVQMSPLLIQIVGEVLPLLMTAISAILPLLTSIIGQILPPIISLLLSLLPTIIQLVEMLLPSIVQLIEQILPPILQIIDSVLPVFVSLIEQILPPVLQIVELVLPILIELIEQILPPIMQIIDMILPLVVSLIQTILPLVLTLIESVLPILTSLLETLAPILEPILTLLTTLLEPLISLLNLILPPLITLISSIIERQLPLLQGAIELVAGVVGGSFSNAFASIQQIFSNAKSIFQNLIDFVKNVFTGNWKGAWQNIVNIFSSVWDNMKTIAKTPINLIIEGINTLIEGINKISFDVPEWVPGIGGKKLGFNIPTIPKLRRGLEYVPRDDYPALLHKGERVLTASEAQAQDRAEEQGRKSKNSGRSGVIVKVNVHIEHFHNETGEDVDDLVDRVIERIDEKIDREGAVFA